MADTTVPIPAAPTADPAVQAVAADVLTDVSLAKTIIQNAHAQNQSALTALMTNLPALIAAGEKNIADVTAALPVFKAGYKTTEFWLSLAVLLANGLVVMITGKTLPIDLNIVFAAIVTVYTAARTLAKAFAPAAPTTPAPVPVAAVKAAVPATK